MRPHVVIHTSVSVDGKATGFEVDMGVHYRLAGSFDEDATLAGTDTLLTGLEAEGLEPDEAASADPPAASSEDPIPDPTSDPTSEATPEATPEPDSKPLLVVPDSRGRLRHWRWLLGSGYWTRGVSLCTARTPKEHREYLDRVGVAAIEAGEERVDLVAALDALASEYDVERVRADCGGRLAGALLHAGLVDEVSLLVHPVVAGAEEVGWYVEPAGASSAPTLRRTKLEPVGEALTWTVYEVVRGS